MVGKLLIQCELVTITGLHIGGTDTFSAIGAVDSPVIRDARTGRPIVPGSSLKGKLRSLLARSISKDIEKMPDFDEDAEEIKALFGSSKPVHAARAQFADCFLINFDEMKQIGLTEVKTENGIRLSDSVANPRQIERVVSGVKFGVCITYNQIDEEQTRKDLELLARGLKLLEMDYLGGHGSRGSGRVSFRNFRVSNENNEDLGALAAIFDVVNEYELFPDQISL